MKRHGIIALLLTLCVIAAGCSAKTDNKNEKGTEGNTSVSVSQSTTAKAGETTTAANGKEGATLETVDGDYVGEVVTFGPADNQENNSKKENKDKDKKDETESSTSSSGNQSYETPIFPIP